MQMHQESMHQQLEFMMTMMLAMMASQRMLPMALPTLPQL
jgi:hypothetical protein